MQNQKAKPPYRRSRKYVRPDLQARLILGSLGVTLIVSFVGTHIPLLGLWQFTAANGGENNALIDHMSRYFTASFYVSILLTASLATWFGYWYSFRFCGPIFAIKKYFVEMQNGSWNREMRLRQKDDLQDVKDAINVGVGAMRNQITSQRAVLEAAANALEKSGTGDENCAVVLASIRAELEVCTQRFPSADDHVEEPSESVPASVSASESASVSESQSETETNDNVVV